MDIKISGPEEVVSEMATGLPATQARLHIDEGLGLGGSAFLAAAADTLIGYCSELFKKLLPYVTARPNLEFEVTGPGGSVKLKVGNLSEEALFKALQFAAGQRPE